MNANLKTSVLAVLAVAMIVAVAGCLPFPLGDPAKSQLDPKLAGYWMADSGDDRELIALFPFDQHTYVLEDLKLKHLEDKWQPQGPPQLFKAWLTNVKDQRFMTLEYLQQRLPGAGSEQKVYPALRLTADGDAILTRLVNSDADLIKNVKSAAEVQAVISRELNNPDLYSGEGTRFHRLDPDRDKETLQPLVNS